ncbi:hypothetical protein D3C80_1003000 [compost metagenome]
MELDSALLELTGSICQQGSSAKGSVVSDVLELCCQLLHFGAHCCTVCGSRSAVGPLSGQILHALNNIAHLVHGPFGGLHHGDGILGIAHADLLTAGLGLQTGRHLQTGGVIGGGVDAKASAQTLHGSAQHLVGGVQLTLGGQGGEVGMNGQAHDVFLDVIAALQPVRLTSEIGDPSLAKM